MIAVFPVRRERFQKVGYLVAEEHRYYRGRRFVRAETVVVARRRDGQPQQVLMLVDGAYHRREEEHELQIVFKILARFEQILAVGRGYRPVVVLARSVDALEGFFVHTSPCRAATLRMTAIVSWLWSVAILTVEYIGASSC